MHVTYTAPNMYARLFLPAPKSVCFVEHIQTQNPPFLAEGSIDLYAVFEIPSVGFTYVPIVSLVNKAMAFQR